MIKEKLLAAFQRTLPNMSHTEREALEAGTTWWDNYLFNGEAAPWFWNSVSDLRLTEEEQAFLDGPVQELCEMLDDYDINQNRKDLPPEVWDFLKENRFFGMIIPKEYGGLGFSAYGHSEVVIKIATRSIAAAVTVMVPNSLGPAELLLHYGTAAEQNYYLPKLASGEEIPCFGLTNPTAGSDASSIPDVATVVRNEAGELELEVTLNKRYITLAPVATLIGLAVKVRDPDNLLPESIQKRLKEGRDITVLLVPRDTEGLDIGRRHNPLDVSFMNGPIRGDKIRLPLSSILGGYSNIGLGWAMLMDCLSVGRAISLPSLACAGGRMTARRIGAYARLREQFRLHIGKFEGVEEKLALIAGHAFIMDAARKLTILGIDQYNQKPSVLSAINKYHLTEMNRESIDAAMDIQGGAGICLGPKNFMGQVYKSIPVSITVEGANIMTRNLIIFGQGAMRCHNYVMKEIEAAKENDADKFMLNLSSHIKQVMANFGRTVFRGIAPSDPLMRFSSAFSFTAEVAMLMLGGSLKRKERISARLGDILSYLYLLTAIRVEYRHNDQHSHDVYLWAEQTLLHKTQEAFYDLYANFPNKVVGRMLRMLSFPYGRRFAKPSDKLEHKVAQVILQPGKDRDALVEGAFVSNNGDDKTFQLERALGLASSYKLGWLPRDIEEDFERWVNEIIQVDDFGEL